MQLRAVSIIYNFLLVLQFPRWPSTFLPLIFNSHENDMFTFGSTFLFSMQPLFIAPHGDLHKAG